MRDLLEGGNLNYTLKYVKHFFHLPSANDHREPFVAVQNVSQAGHVGISEMGVSYALCRSEINRGCLNERVNYN